MSSSQESQERRANNRRESARILAEEGINYSLHNDGAHIVVDHNGRQIDFWPGTGLWIDRHWQKRRRGVRPLIDYIKTFKRSEE